MKLNIIDLSGEKFLRVTFEDKELEALKFAVNDYSKNVYDFNKRLLNHEVSLPTPSKELTLNWLQVSVTIVALQAFFESVLDDGYLIDCHDYNCKYKDDEDHYKTCFNTPEDIRCLADIAEDMYKSILSADDINDSIQKYYDSR